MHFWKLSANYSENIKREKKVTKNHGLSITFEFKKRGTINKESLKTSIY